MCIRDSLKGLDKKASTISRHLASIRLFYQYLLKNKIVKEDPTKGIQSPKIEKKAPSVLSSQEVSLLLEQPNGEGLKSIRDKAMLEVAYATGMRVTEIISLNAVSYTHLVGHCIRGLKGTPIKINSLEKFVNIWAKENNVSYEIKKVQNINKKVAIIGAGPAGIACAIDLAKNGASVTIFEKESSLGGILEYGIP